MRYVVLTYVSVEEVSGLLQLLGSTEETLASLLLQPFGQGQISSSLYWFLQLSNHELDRVPRAGRGTDLLLAVLLFLVRWLASAGSCSLGRSLGLGRGSVCLGRRAEGGHHHLAAHRAIGTPAASRKLTGWIFRHVHHLGVHERRRDGDVDVEGAKGELVADGWDRPLAKTAYVVKDQMLRAESLHQS